MIERLKIDGKCERDKEIFRKEEKNRKQKSSCLKGGSEKEPVRDERQKTASEYKEKERE